MAYVLIKRNRFLSGHGYSTLHGYSFTWAQTEAEARRFSDTDGRLDFYRNATGARIERRTNTRAELRSLGRQAMAILRRSITTDPIHARINDRAQRANLRK